MALGKYSLRRSSSELQSVDWQSIYFIKDLPSDTVITAEAKVIRLVMDCIQSITIPF